MGKFSGYVEKIVYHNEENGYTVLILNSDEEEISCVGNFGSINEGEYITVQGEKTTHSLYGEQIKVDQYDVEMPKDVVTIEKYLGSGVIKGIGQILAQRIVKTFKEDTFRIIEEEPEQLSNVKGITEKKAREIAETFSEKRELRQVMMYLQKYGISTAYAIKIYNQYGNNLREVVEKNPYRLAEDIAGIGFKIADDIAMKMGIASNSDYRVCSGIMYMLSEASANGHTYLPLEKLFRKVTDLLDADKESIERNIIELAMSKKIVMKQLETRTAVYSIQYYYMEIAVAKKLLELAMYTNKANDEINKEIELIERSEDIKLDTLQKQAIIEAANSGLLIVTGGPGTGKTTTINSIIKYFEQQGMDIVLAAPTGRAAKRMTEATGYQAQTIHRLLEISGGISGENQKMHFEKCEDNPIEADVVIIDETSMVDIVLINALMKAIIPGTKVIFVGDVDQLPSVGPGNVLKDMIKSEKLNVVRLSKIFRQSEESDIVINAHKINQGEEIDLTQKNKDFYFIKREDQDRLLRDLLILMRDRLPKLANGNPLNDIQVLTPMRKSALGVEALNKILQKTLNPPSKDKREKEYRQNIYREGDKVMQIKNNYQMPWSIKSRTGFVIEEGTGIFNGDMGIIKEINLYAETLSIDFDDGKCVTYEFNQLDEIELSYAVTVHKSQGSEYPIVVLPLLTGSQLLFNRNILYTAVTRAKQMVVIIGSEYTVNFMIGNKNEIERYSGLAIRIKEEEEI
ncbi:MAG: helicase, RecD/TraA family [Clostridiales bacterium]|jgi:exodeoxyribonuclease V alpha subunit|nr:helicase, RecD/TraA family [Clostridiales bacterium]